MYRHGSYMTAAEREAVTEDAVRELPRLPSHVPAGALGTNEGCAAIGSLLFGGEMVPDADDASLGAEISLALRVAAAYLSLPMRDTGRDWILKAAIEAWRARHDADDDTESGDASAGA